MANRDLFKVIWFEYRNSARKKSQKWTLPFEFFKALIQKPCYYCGETPTPTRRKEACNIEKTHGLDRKIPDEGYTPHNIVPCCTDCNYMKSNRTRHEFMRRVRAIYETSEDNNGTG